MEHPHISSHYMLAIVTHLLNHKRTTNPKVVCLAVSAAQLEHRSKSRQKLVKESDGGWRNCIYIILNYFPPSPGQALDHLHVVVLGKVGP